MTNQQKFAVIVVTPEGERQRIMPRSKKTALFTSMPKAIRALDNESIRLKVNGYRGLVYATPYTPESQPIYTMTL